MSRHRWIASTITALALFGSLLPSVSRAAAASPLPFGELTFIAPTGTATNTEVIDVWARFTLDSNSAALSFSSNPLAIDPLLVPTEGYYFLPAGGRELRSFASVFQANLNVFAGCSGSFIGDCSPGSSEYTFDFNFGANSVIGLNAVDVQPGQHLDFVLGRFTPKAGGAAPGTYNFQSMGLTLEFVGLDANNNVLFTDGALLGTQCAGCEFSRSVTAVPEPESWALMLAGMAGIGFIARLRGGGATARPC